MRNSVGSRFLPALHVGSAIIILGTLCSLRVFAQSTSQPAIDAALQALQRHLSAVESIEYSGKTVTRLPSPDKLRSLAEAKGFEFKAIDDAAFHAIRSGAKFRYELHRPGQEKTFCLNDTDYRTYNPGGKAGEILPSEAGGRMRELGVEIPDLTPESFAGLAWVREWADNPDSYEAKLVHETESELSIRITPKKIAKGQVEMESELVFDKTKDLALVSQFTYTTDGLLQDVYRVVKFETRQSANGTTIWFPVEGEMEQHDFFGEFCEEPFQVVTMKIDDLKVDQTHGDEVFTLEFPAGTTVQDRKLGTSYTVGEEAGDPREILAELPSDSANNKPQRPDTSEDLGEQPPASNSTPDDGAKVAASRISGRHLVLLLAAVVAGALLSILRKRRSS